MVGSPMANRYDAKGQTKSRSKDPNEGLDRENRIPPTLPHGQLPMGMGSIRQSPGGAQSKVQIGQGGQRTVQSGYTHH